MMEKILFEAVGQVPALAVMTVLVVVFLKHMTKRDEVIKEIATENREAFRESTAAIKENTTRLAENSVYQKKAASALEKLGMAVESNGGH